MSRLGGSRRAFEIFSIFGVCEGAAAQHLIDRGDATKIEASEIPPAVAVNKLGHPARFAVIIQRRHIPEFERLCRDLRA